MPESSAATRWVHTPIDPSIHDRTRVEAVRRRLRWNAVVEEALRLWLAAYEPQNDNGKEVM
jgi:hypothetical protein